MEVEKTASADLVLPVTHRWFKSLIVKLLAQLKQGHLLIRDQDETLLFGQPDSHPSAILEVHHSQFYMRLFTSGSNGAADSFIDGDSGPTHDHSLHKLIKSRSVERLQVRF